MQQGRCGLASQPLMLIEVQVQFEDNVHIVGFGFKYSPYKIAILYTCLRIRANCFGGRGIQGLYALL